MSINALIHTKLISVNNIVGKRIAMIRQFFFFFFFYIGEKNNFTGNGKRNLSKRIHLWHGDDFCYLARSTSRYKPSSEREITIRRKLQRTDWRSVRLTTRYRRNFPCTSDSSAFCTPLYRYNGETCFVFATVSCDSDLRQLRVFKTASSADARI